MYIVKCEFTLQQIVQLKILTGMCSNLTTLYNITDKIVEKENVNTVTGQKFFNGACFDHILFQKLCYDNVIKSQRKTIILGDRTYYVDELETALASIKPIP